MDLPNPRLAPTADAVDPKAFTERLAWSMAFVALMALSASLLWIDAQSVLQSRRDAGATRSDCPHRDADRSCTAGTL
jgi:hypothetical protein